MGKKKILIVEDSPTWQELLRQILDGDDYEVLPIVETAAGAIAATQQHKPDVIIMDGTLADEADGLEVAANIRSFNDTVRIIMLSGAAETPKFEGVGFDKGQFQTSDLRAAVRG